MKKKISILLVLAIMCCLVISPLAGAMGFDPDKKASLVITMEYQDTAISGIELTIYRVADITLVKSNFNWVINSQFAGAAGIDFSNLDTDANLDMAAILAEYAETHDIAGITKTTDSNGKADFGNDLDLGLYLVVQTNTHEDYYDILPYLVSLPTETADGLNYAVEAAPKSEISEKDDEDEPPVIPPKFPEDIPGTPVPTDEGTFEVIDENGVPLGELTFDEDQNIWIFDERPPLAELPQTGVLRWPIPVMAVAGLLLFCIGWVINRKKEDQYEA